MQPGRHQPLRWEPVRIERPWENEPLDATDMERVETRRKQLARRENRWGRRHRSDRMDRAAAIVSRAVREWRRRAAKAGDALFGRRGSLEYTFDQPPRRYGKAWSFHRLTLASVLYLLPVLAGGLGIVAFMQHSSENRLTRSPKALDTALSRASVVEDAQPASKRAMPDFSVIDELPSRELVVAEKPVTTPAVEAPASKSIDPQPIVVTATPVEVAEAKPSAADAPVAARKSPADAEPEKESAKVAAVAAEDSEKAADADEQDTASDDPDAASAAQTGARAGRQGSRSRRSERTAARTPAPPSLAPEARATSPAFIAQANADSETAVSATAAVAATGGVRADQPKADERSAVEQAQAHLQAGNVMAARRLLRRGAWANDAASIQLLAQTYDPNVLARVKARRGRPDVATARKLYDRAKSLGAAGGDPGR